MFNVVKLQSLKLPNRKTLPSLLQHLFKMSMLSKLVSWRDFLSDYIHSSIPESEEKRKQFKYAAIASISIVSISCLVQYGRIRKRNKANKALDAYFSSTYHSARDKFRDAVSKIKSAKHHAIVIDTECDLSIDLCFIEGDRQSKHVMLHFCGTHGVEGFAGSAIQIHLLKHTIPQILNSTIDRERPHILFVHALNSYGMSQNRRFSKSNIDLNRNCILSNRELWNEVFPFIF